MANRGGCWTCLCHPRAPGSHYHWGVYYCVAESFDGMGGLFGSHGYGAGSNPILPTDLDHVPSKTRWELEHPNDVYSDTWWLFVRRESVR